MSELLKEMMDLKRKERDIQTNIRKSEQEERTLDDTIKFESSKIEDKVEVEKQKYVAEQTEEIRGLHQPKIDALKQEIASIDEKMGHDHVDETEELAAARERKEYLDEAAVAIDNYYNALREVSLPYFIDIAYTENKFNMKGFKTAFKALPARQERVLKVGESGYPRPFDVFSHGSKLTSHTYIRATLGAILVALSLPKRIKQAVDRAHYLHESSELYHKLMHTLMIFKNKTDEEVNLIFGKLLMTKRQQLAIDKDVKEKELEALEEFLKSEFDKIEFDGDSIRRQASLLEGQNKKKLEELRNNIEQLKVELLDITTRLAELQEEHSDFLESERKLYLEPSEERDVVLPNELLYGFTKTSNSKIEFKPGLYLYSDREIVADFMRLTLFQIRNIMAWGSVQFRVIDLLGAEAIAPLMLPNDGKAKNQDITISTLREEREQLIDLMHDLLVRRKTQVLAVTSDLASYNTIQKESGSAPIPYQIIYVILTEAIKPDEKLIQLIHNGEKLGLLVLVFMKDELLTIQIAKSIETFFTSFVELTSTGLSSYPPAHYREMLEQAEADRKSGI